MLTNQLRSTLSRGYISNQLFIKNISARQCKFTSVYFRLSYQVIASQLTEPQNNFLHLLKVADDFKCQLTKRVNQLEIQTSSNHIKHLSQVISEILEKDYVSISLYEKVHDQILELVVKELKISKRQGAEQQQGLESFHKILMILRIMHDFRIKDMNCWFRVFEEFSVVSESFKDFPDLTLEIIGEIRNICSLFLYQEQKFHHLLKVNLEEVKQILFIWYVPFFKQSSQSHKDTNFYFKYQTKLM